MTDTEQNIIDGVNRIKELLEAEAHPEQRTQIFATAMAELRNWSKTLSKTQIVKVSLDQIPERAKPLLNYVIAKYGKSFHNFHKRIS